LDARYVLYCRVRVERNMRSPVWWRRCDLLACAGTAVAWPVRRRVKPGRKPSHLWVSDDGRPGCVWTLRNRERWHITVLDQQFDHPSDAVAAAMAARHQSAAEPCVWDRIGWRDVLLGTRAIDRSGLL